MIELEARHTPICGVTWHELVRIESQVNVTLIGCTISDVDGVGMEIVGSHNVRLIGCRVLRCGGASRNPAILIRAGGDRAKPVPNDVVLSSCQVEANTGTALLAEAVANLTLTAGTKLHGRYDMSKPEAEQDPNDDQLLLWVMRGQRIYVGRSCLFTGGPEVSDRPLVRLPSSDARNASVQPRWGDRTSGRRGSVAFEAARK